MPDDKPMPETICYLIVQVAKANRNCANSVLAGFGLYMGQEILLMHLWESGRLTQSELVERMEIEPPTLTKMLQRLEKSGLVVRQKDPEDARIVWVGLTDAGQALQEPVFHCWNELESRIVKDLTLEEQLLLRRLLLQVRRNLS
jgi:DNA-binding MarR family transcriptional regulator